MSLTIKIKRATRSQLNTAAGLGNLAQGELYLITDEGRVAVGLTDSTYAELGDDMNTRKLTMMTL